MPLAATVHIPVGAPSRAVLCCFPGGGMTRRYFDMQGASFAQAMAARGFVSVAIDHPATGDSAAPADGYHLSAKIVAEAGAAAVDYVAGRLRAGDLHAALPPMPEAILIGVGHSMGGMIATMIQAASRPFAGLALVGFSTRGLPELLTEAERAVSRQALRSDADYARLAQARFGAPLADLPARETGSAALKAAAGPLLTVAAMQSMMPRNIMAEAAGVDVPLLLAVGDRDITGRAEAIAPAFPAAPAIQLLVLENAGHHPFIAASAADYYAALGGWAAALAA